MPPIGTEKDAFSRMDVAFIWSHECPAGCAKTGRTTIFHSFLRTKKLPCLCQLSCLAFLRFLPLFQISVDFKMRKIAPNYDCSSCFSHPEPRGIQLKMSFVLLNFEKEALGRKLKVTESPLSYINQQRRLESEIALSIYMPYPILMKWHELVEMKDERGNEFNYTLIFLIFGFLVDGLN